MAEERIRSLKVTIEVVTNFGVRRDVLEWFEDEDYETFASRVAARTRDLARIDS